MKKYKFFIKYLLLKIKNFYLSREKIFSNIYDNNLWMKKTKFVSKANRKNFYSGPGSHQKHVVDNYISALSNFFKLNAKDRFIIVDLGCGDFNIGFKLIKIFKDNIKLYFACDVVIELIVFHSKKNNIKFLTFHHTDIVDEQLINGDIYILRQVLQHLSNKDIIKVINKINRSNARYLIFTDHKPFHPSFPNADINSGKDTRLSNNSYLDITVKPFNLSYKSMNVIDTTEVSNGIICTIVFTLK